MENSYTADAAFSNITIRDESILGIAARDE